MKEIIAYIFLCVILVLQQCVILEIIKIITNLFRKYKFHYYSLTITILLILFINFYGSTLIIAGFIYEFGVFDTFNECLSFSLDSFSTLGSTSNLQQPWSFLGSIIAIIGLTTIAFITTSTFNIITTDKSLLATVI